MPTLILVFMDAGRAQTLCQGGIAICVILGALFTWGSNHFGKIKSDESGAATKLETAETRKTLGELKDEVKNATSIIRSVNERIPEIEGIWFREAVASILKTLKPDARIAIGPLLDSPEGFRKVDIWISGRTGSKELSIIIECVDIPTGAAVDVEYVDKIDSARRDLKADKAFICSNTGFTDMALAKASRVDVGMLSILKKDDGKAQTVVQASIVSELTKILRLSVQMTFITTDGGKDLRAQGHRWDDFYFEGRPVSYWVRDEVERMTSYSRREDSVKYVFKTPVAFFAGKNVMVAGMEIHIEATKGFYTHNIELESSSAIFDHLNGIVAVTNGDVTFRPEDTSKWKPYPRQDDLFQPTGPRLRNGKSSPIRIKAFVGLPKFGEGPAPDLTSHVQSRLVTKTSDW